MIKIKIDSSILNEVQLQCYVRPFIWLYLKIETDINIEIALTNLQIDMEVSQREKTQELL